MHSKSVKGYVFAVLSAVIYGSMPLMSKYIYADGVNPLTLVFLRNAFSLIPLGLLAYGEHKTLKIPGKLLPSIALIGVLGCSITPILLFSSYQFIPSGTATVIHFAYPAVVMIGGLLFFRQKLRLWGVVSMMLCITGICMFYAPEESLDLTGSLLALASAVSFASYVLLLSRFDSSKVSGFLFNFYVTAVCTVFTLIVCLATNSLALPASLSGWGLCVVFSLLVTTGAVVLFQQSTFLIGGDRASILSTLEPITSVVLGCIFFQEPFGIRVALGTGLVVAASILIVLPGKRTQKNT
jgi:drug/metabolite transporter (DMT)-like permease